MAYQPRDWCDPKESFGRLTSPRRGGGEPVRVRRRVWDPPDPTRDPVAVSKFRAAVMQNVIVLAVREHKNLKGVPQEELARLDPRADSMNQWNARLCGRVNLTPQDMVTLMMLLPGAMPGEDAVRTMIDVAEGTMSRPDYWNFPDTSTRTPPE